MMPFFEGGCMPPGQMPCCNPFLPNPSMPGMVSQFGAVMLCPPLTKAQQEENLKNSLQFQKNQLAMMRKQLNDQLKMFDESEAAIDKQLKEIAQSQSQRKSTEKKNG